MQIFKEREREMALLRIHGESYLKIWLSLFLEMIIVGVLGLFISCVISYPLILLITRILGVNGEIIIGFMGILKTFLISFGIILVVAALKLVNIYKLKLADITKLSE
jgi:ABC-type antimicrobial peptide transport system permease subunit